MSALGHNQTHAPQHKERTIRSTRPRGRSIRTGQKGRCVVADCTTMLTDQAEQETHVAAVGSAFRRLESIGPPHLAQVPYVPLDIRFRAASI
jgi:hypothetical protein